MKLNEYTEHNRCCCRWFHFVIWFFNCVIDFCIFLRSIFIAEHRPRGSGRERERNVVFILPKTIQQINRRFDWIYVRSKCAVCVLAIDQSASVDIAHLELHHLKTRRQKTVCELWVGNDCVVISINMNWRINTDNSNALIDAMRFSSLNSTLVGSERELIPIQIRKRDYCQMAYCTKWTKPTNHAYSTRTTQDKTTCETERKENRKLSAFAECECAKLTIFQITTNVTWWWCVAECVLYSEVKFQLQAMNWRSHTHTHEHNQYDLGKKVKPPRPNRFWSNIWREVNSIRFHFECDVRRRFE